MVVPVVGWKLVEMAGERRRGAREFPKAKEEDDRVEEEDEEEKVEGEEDEVEPEEELAATAALRRELRLSRNCCRGMKANKREKASSLVYISICSDAPPTVSVRVMPLASELAPKDRKSSGRPENICTIRGGNMKQRAGSKSLVPLSFQHKA